MSSQSVKARQSWDRRAETKPWSVDGSVNAAIVTVRRGGIAVLGGTVEIKQQQHSNKIRFLFGEDQLDYSIQDSSGSRSFSVPYADISRDRQTLVERNQWLRNVGLLWIMLGVGFTAYSLTGDSGFRVSPWVWIGAACLAVYHFRFTHFTLVPTEKGNLFVITEEDGARVLQEIEARRADYFRRQFDFMPEEDSPEQLRNRFKWLHREGVLSDDELKQRMDAVDAKDPAVIEQAAPPRMLLN